MATATTATAVALQHSAEHGKILYHEVYIILFCVHRELMRERARQRDREREHTTAPCLYVNENDEQNPLPMKIKLMRVP